MWDLSSQPGIESMPPALGRGVLTTGTPGRSLGYISLGSFNCYINDAGNMYYPLLSDENSWGSWVLRDFPWLHTVPQKRWVLNRFPQVESRECWHQNHTGSLFNRQMETIQNHNFRNCLNISASYRCVTYHLKLSNSLSWLSTAVWAGLSSANLCWPTQMSAQGSARGQACPGHPGWCMSAPHASHPPPRTSKLASVYASGDIQHWWWHPIQQHWLHGILRIKRQGKMPHLLTQTLLLNVAINVEVMY